MIKTILFGAIVLPVAALALDSGAIGVPAPLDGIGIDQHLGAQLPLDTQFRDESGQTVPLRAYFGHKPVLLALVYYTCPMLCNQILTGMAAGLSPLSLRPGRDFEIVAISINPAETPADATAKRQFASRRYSTKLGTNGWHFLVGDQASIQAVAGVVGFHYRYDPASKMFFHASGIMAVTPQGKLARYFYGVDFEPKDLKLGLIEASHDAIGSLADQVLLFCYHYDPKTGKYSAAILNLLKGAGIFALALMAAGLGWLWRRDLRAHRPAFKEVSRL